MNQPAGGPGDALTTCWKHNVGDIPAGPEKTRWTGIFGAVLKDFSEKLIHELDDENYAALAFKKRLAVGLDAVIARLLPSVQSFADVHRQVESSGGLGDAIHVQKLRDRVDRELLEAPETIDVEEPAGNGRKHSRGEVDLDYESGSSLSPPPPRRKWRTKEEIERDNRRIAQGKAPEFRWTSATQLRLQPIDSSSPTLCQDTYRWYTEETISGKSIKTMYKSSCFKLITRMESIYKHVLKEYALLPLDRRNAAVRGSMRQEVLTPYYDKVLMADEELAKGFRAGYSGGALVVIGRAVLELYMADFNNGFI
ncbi:hypothetical protein CJU89_6150 [Yarrowia sp. B02]|nr:hypothetical protein CJU89_6150 [Yarrowia sp. B02]